MVDVCAMQIDVCIRLLLGCFYRTIYAMNQSDWLNHTTTVQPSSHNQRHVLIGKQWYQLPELIWNKITPLSPFVYACLGTHVSMHGQMDNSKI